MTECTEAQRREDQNLEASVQQVLFEVMEPQEYPVGVVARQGTVELRGALPSADLRQFASQQALDAEGVD
ncbi:MAG: BON domain-containing protein [Dehalococcoidales bacterium]|nr:BON domain-containing protein [Dehalococcoidales bacterium]